MLQAIIASWRSPDPNTQVGAVIVDHNKCIVSTGYNGFPRGITACSFPWDRDKENPLENKYTYVVHAEKNAIVNAGYHITGCTLYVTMYPCNSCAKDVIQAGIRKIIFLENPYYDQWTTQAAAKMFEHLDIEVIQHEWQNPETVSLCLDNLLKLVKQKLQ
jgi:dCMP deaminase